MKKEATLGERGERLAVRYLRGLGYRIAATNVRLPVGRAPDGRPVTGEIDVVAYDGDTLVFVEVKTRRREGLREIVRFTYSPTGDNPTRDSLNHAEVIA